MNALIQAASHGTMVQGATLYSTTFPCSLCAKMLINGGIARIVAQTDYADDLGKELLYEAGIRVDLFDFNRHRTVEFPLGTRSLTRNSRPAEISGKGENRRKKPKKGKLRRK